ncbi:glycosyltransferase family 2 protein [Herpetosiphon llansteffanensis]|uniref:glycosyltransferase family 2 protein n=1 Tax=Herpetosiphon llansteffanensis TaxID=2094568 RepID=UPI000D7D2256
MMLLSVLIPCYNEAATIAKMLERLAQITIPMQWIAVDDCSKDATYQVLQQLTTTYPHMQVVRHSHNSGKGAAIRTALTHATGEIVVIQDADLEYDPQDFYELIKPIEAGLVNVAFGSRFMGRHTGMYFWNAIGNKGLTFLTNLLFNCWISDMETCYKVMRTDIMRSMNLVSSDFRIEAEITAKVLMQGERIFEVPITYLGRTYEEGKKMHPKYGFLTVWALFRLRLLGRP